MGLQFQVTSLVKNWHSGEHGRRVANCGCVNVGSKRSYRSSTEAGNTALSSISSRAHVSDIGLGSGNVPVPCLHKAPSEKGRGFTLTILSNQRREAYDTRFEVLTRSLSTGSTWCYDQHILPVHLML